MWYIVCITNELDEQVTKTEAMHNTNHTHQQSFSKGKAHMITVWILLCNQGSIAIVIRRDQYHHDGCEQDIMIISTT